VKKSPALQGFFVFAAAPEWLDARRYRPLQSEVFGMQNG
jgi:hypothetical protein